MERKQQINCVKRKIKFKKKIKQARFVIASHEQLLRNSNTVVKRLTVFNSFVFTTIKFKRKIKYC